MTARIKGKLRGATRGFDAPLTTAEKIQSRGEAIMRAASQLIGMVRMTEAIERERATKTEMEVDIGLTDGGTETWTITIERIASTH